jgi:hypothetical protein
VADRDIEQVVDRYTPAPYRILVTGSRDWTDRSAIHRALLNAAGSIPFTRVTVVHGAARGADGLAHDVALKLGMMVEPHNAEWSRHGKSAGHVRNAHMVSLGADVCLAFPLGESRGTRGCMEMAERAGIPVINLGVAAPEAQPDLFGAAS